MSEEVRTVYAVSKGDYSSYQVQCLFEKEADAQAYADAIKDAMKAEYKRDWGEDATDAELYGIPFVERFQMWSVVPIAKLNEWGDPELPSS